ncbi:MAG: hypothetical protein HeimC3_43000 [Candidatus Heimdallarchaeota archaeon LC_3]|nr:MAG: hypothetical protein HeimC3_43000 [Candidatus Heimdallarchaeota archaeon LC_3]
MISTKIKEKLFKFYPLDFPIQVKDKENMEKLKSFIFDIRNSSLGDSLINFAYSCAKTLNNGKPSSNKVPDLFLIEGYYNSNIKEYLKLTGEKKKLGNYLEALIFLSWVYNLLTLDEIIERLTEEMNPEMFISSIDEKRSAEKSFSRLFNIINNLIFEK